jgi:hypothetical protein
VLVLGGVPCSRGADGELRSPKKIRATQFDLDSGRLRLPFLFHYLIFCVGSALPSCLAIWNMSLAYGCNHFLCLLERKKLRKGLRENRCGQFRPNSHLFSCIHFVIKSVTSNPTKIKDDEPCSVRRRNCSAEGGLLLLLPRHPRHRKMNRKTNRTAMGVLKRGNFPKTLTSIPPVS